MEVMCQTCRHLMDKKPKLGLTFASHGAQIQGGESSEIYFEQICRKIFDCLDANGDGVVKKNEAHLRGERIVF